MGAPKKTLRFAEKESLEKVVVFDRYLGSKFYLSAVMSALSDIRSRRMERKTRAQSQALLG